MRKIIALTTFLILVNFVASAHILSPIVSSTVPSVDECSGFLICQNFEGTGYDNSESWTETTTNGGVDEDYTTTALRGSQSLFITKTGIDGGYTDITFSAQSTVYVFFRFHFPSDPTTDAATFFKLLDGTDTDLAALQANNATTLRGFNGTTNMGFGADLNAATTYFCWATFVTGSGSDSQLTFWIGTTTTKPGSSYLTNSAGDATTNAVKIRFYSADTGANGIIIDQVYVSTTEIGNVSS